MSLEVTSLRPEEYSEMMRFLEKSYRHSREYFQTRYPHVWRRDTVQYDNKIVLKLDDKIVSHVGIFPLTMVVGKAKVNIGGIGAVATLQEYRGRGFMTKLMKAAIRKMKADGYSLSILWGDRQRYGHFGYETVGRLTLFRVSLRSLKVEAKVSETPFERFYGEDELLSKIIQAHEREPIRILRSRRTYELLFNIPYLMTYVSDEGAYISYMRERTPQRVIEYGGSGEGVVSLIYSILKAFNREFGTSSVEVMTPYYPYNTFLKLRKVCCSLTTIPEAMVKILDLVKLFKEYSPYLEGISEKLRLDVVFEIKETSSKAKLTLDHGQVSVEAGGSADLVVSLEERDMAKLIFDGPETTSLPSSKRALLKTFLPLPLHVWPLDHI